MNTNNYLPFDLETALKHPERVVTKNGKPVTQLTSFNVTSDWPLFAVIYNQIFSFNRCGACMGQPSHYDLFLLPEVKECWVNVYDNGYLWTGNCFPTKERAESDGKKNPQYIKTIRITNEPE